MIIEKRGTRVSKESAMQRPVRKRLRNKRNTEVFVPSCVKKFWGAAVLQLIGLALI
jgi:hypothetical protein